MCLLNSYYTNDVKLSQEEIDYHKHNIYSDSPAVYVGTYHKYNCGSLAGMWVDLSTFVDYAEFIDFCHALHCDEADPDYMRLCHGIASFFRLFGGGAEGVSLNN